MASISLRSYNREIEGMIDHGQIDEAIAHCMHILQFVPKHIGTYRLLGKAFLECKRYSEAADIFQRVLSSVPDDFVANIGMSIIREDEKSLDAAIWHMERAFEAQPSNAAIQEELRRLYGRRDGLEPPKVRLTRGALSRMYFKGNLLNQAIGELRAALSDDPQRTDLQVLLAQAYYANGQQTEAADTCNTIIKKLPYCLEANRILAAILPDTDQALNAKEYQQRLISLDPYYGSTSPKASSSDQVPEKAVVVERLDYMPNAPGAATDQPAWASNLGVTLEPEQESLPEWLSADEMPIPIPSKTPLAEEQDLTAPETPQESEEPIPDWMKEAGWAASTGPEQPPPPLENLEETPHTEGELVPGEVPDWLREIAPSGALDQEPAITEGVNPDEEVLPWLQESQPGATDSVISWLDKQNAEVTPPAEPEAVSDSGAEAEIPAWMSGIGEETEKANAETPSPDEELPDWMKEIQGTEETASGVTDWLGKLGVAAAVVKAAAPEDEPAPLEEPEEWMKPTGEEQPLSDEVAVEGLSLEPPSPVEELPDWLTGIEAEAEEITPIPAISEQMASSEPPLVVEPAPEAEVPDWLTSSEAEAEEITPVPVLSEQMAPSEAPPVVETAPEAEVPDWLKEIEAEAEEITPVPVQFEEMTPSEPVQAAEPAPEEEIPDWLKAIEDKTFVEPTVTVIPSSEIAPETLPETFDEASSLAWLESLARKQGVPEDQLTTPQGEQPAEIPIGSLETPEEVLSAELEEEVEEPAVPEWLAGEAQPEAALPGEETPDWLKTMAGAALASEFFHHTEEPEEQPAVPAEEIPDWLKAVENEVPVEEEPTLLAPAPLETTILPEEMDQDTAIAWLESLAAKAAVPEEQLTPQPEEAAEETAPWILETPSVPEQLEAESVSEPEKSEVVFPDWLIQATETELSQEPAQPEEAIPEWLAGIEAETPLKAALQEPEPILEETPQVEGIEPSVSEVPAVEAGAEVSEEAPQDEALAWLETLARKQGVPEEQLVTHPLKPVEEPPAWVQEDVEAAAEFEETKPTPIAAEQMEAPAEITEPEITAEVIEPVTPTEEIIPGMLVPEAEQPAAFEIEEETAPVQVEPIIPTDETLPSWLASETVPSTLPEVEEEVAPVEVEPVQKLNINTATLSELEALPAIGFTLAQAILNYKEEHGNFLSLDELDQVPGIGQERIDTIKDLVEVVPSWEPTKYVEEVILPQDEDEQILAQGRNAAAKEDVSAALDSFSALVHKKTYLPEVITELMQVLKQRPDNLIGWQTLGDAYVRNDQLQEALAAYIKAEELLS